MKLPGYCTGCHRTRRVNVSGSMLAMMAARGSNIPEGTCDECQEAEDARCRRR